MNISDVFCENCHLHLVIWNRVNQNDHNKGLHLLKELLEDNEINEKMLIMLRPVGRGKEAYEYYKKNIFKSTCSEEDIPPDILNQPKLVSEMWLQTSETVNDKIEKKISNLCNDNQRIFAFFKHKNPLWAPFSSGLHDCIYAETISHAHSTELFSTIKGDDVAKLLKIIWHRATIAMYEYTFKENNHFDLISLGDKNRLKISMQKILESFNIVEYGFETDLVVDPYYFGVSHLSVFTVNAFTQIENKVTCWIETYYENKDLTQPLKFNTKDKFLEQFDKL